MAPRSQDRSLHKQLTARILLMAAIGVSGLLVSGLLWIFNRIQLVEQQVIRANIEAAGAYNLYLSDLKASVLSAANILQGNDDPQFSLLQIASLNPSILDIFAVDRDRNIIYRYHAFGRPNISQYDREWLPERELNFGETLLSPLTYEGPVPTIDIATPIADRVGIAAGVLIVRVDLSELRNQTSSFKVGDRSRVYILDEVGNPLGDWMQARDRESSPFTDRPDRRPRKIDSVQATFSRNSEGEFIFASTKGLDAAPWLIIVEQPLGEMLGALLLPGIFIALAMLLALLLLWNTIIFFRRRLLQPLATLKLILQGEDPRGALSAISMPVDDEFKGFVTVLTEVFQENGALSSGLGHEMEAKEKAEAQLSEVLKQADESSQTKSEFLTRMSRELRTPLNAILGSSEAIRTDVWGPINAKQTQALRVIEKNSSYLLELVNDILDLAKIESGSIQLNYAPCNVETLCESSLALVRQQAKNKGIVLESKLSGALPHVQMDERRIRQVLVNLLSNAVKFTPEGGRVTLEARLQTATTDPGKTYLFISISDTGIGIAPENIEQLFQPFVQLENSLNQSYEGTGLGLSLTQKIVDLHYGKLGVTSTVGVGSYFTIEIPVAEFSELQPQNPSDRTERDGVDIAKPPAQTATSPAILLAEDNDTNADVIAGYLEAKGYRMLRARDGAEAIEIAQSQRPALIVMDIQMPGMDGLEAMQHLRSSSEHNLRAVPIIALTALAMDDDRERCMAAGATEHLIKPIKLEKLATIIQRLIAPGSMRA